MESYVQYGMYTPLSCPKLASCFNSDGANQSPFNHSPKASRAARKSSSNGIRDSGGIIPSADSGLFSKCVLQNGHFSVTTLSSRSTIAPQPVHLTCDDRPAMMPPFPVSSLRTYSSKSRSRTFSPRPGSAMVDSCPQYGHLSERVRGSNSTF